VLLSQEVYRQRPLFRAARRGEGQRQS
jgi:hypothetical protein